MISPVREWSWQGPIVDHHIHLDKSGQGIEAAKAFKASGGTSILLVHKPKFSSLPIDGEGYRAAYSSTLEMADHIRKKVDIGVGVILGPHPVAWDHQADEIGVQAASEIHLEAVSIALDHVNERDAVGLGEVGRPHYAVSEERWEYANDLLIDVLKMAKEDDSAVQLHVEENGEETCRTIDAIRSKSGLDRKKTIRHYAPPNLSDTFRSKLPCTVSVGRGSITQIIDSWNEGAAYWGMETDYLDDPRRPGAVLGPRTVPRRTKELCDEWIGSGKKEQTLDELLHRVNRDWIESIYGWSPD